VRRLRQLAISSTTPRVAFHFVLTQRSEDLMRANLLHVSDEAVTLQLHLGEPKQTACMVHTRSPRRLSSHVSSEMHAHASLSHLHEYEIRTVSFPIRQRVHCTSARAHGKVQCTLYGMQFEQ
jgi:hypothetical protein